MYIKKYWDSYIGGSDDSLTLVEFLVDQKKEEVPLGEIFAKIGLDKQNWDFRQTVEYLEFTHSSGVEKDFHFAVDVVTDLAAILLECSVSGSVNLQDLDEYNTPARHIRITATAEEHDAMNKALADFAQNPLEYDLSEMMDEDEIREMAQDVEALRKELYEFGGRNRDYHVKAEDVKPLLSDWKGADGCIATNRITVEGCKVGYCYREKPDGDWDSGWRFTAGDESEEYMDDPNNAGIYKLNTICNDDPNIIPLLNTPAPCAFERDENGVFQQIKDWKPEQDEEDPDMDILKQCQKWHEKDQHQKIVDALTALPEAERTPETDMELARAYNNLAVPGEPEGRKLLHQALELMQSHEEELGDTYSWNFRMGYAYYYLDQEGRALRYFEKALELHPGDDPKLNTRQDIEELIDSCKKGISLPQFSACFRERTESTWKDFARQEAQLRRMMDADKDHIRGEEVNFYQVIPLYRDELEYKLAHDADALLDKMEGISFVVEPDRQDAITRGTFSDGDFNGEMDDAARHLETIREKHLPVDEINAYNHMAIYLRWCMEHDLMGVEFIERYNEPYQAFLADIKQADLRSFIRDALKGKLFGALFNKEGAAFAGYYYGESDSPYFPSDIDNYAIGIIGQERNYSDEIQDEAYLFIPFDEAYYQAMAKVIEERFENWQGQDFDEDTLEPSELAEALMEYLDCECTYFPSMKDDDPIMSAYSYAKRESVKEGFVPVLIRADDETLWECLILNSDPDSDGVDGYAFDPDKVAEYRKKMLSAPIKDGKAVLEELTGQRKEEAEDDDLDWDEEILGEMEGGYENVRFSCYWNSDTDMTYPLILAKIPVKNPWEIFAYLPFGNWNDCPDTPDLMAAAKYWFEQYGAVPAAMTHDELEFLLPAPVPKEKAMDVAVELYGFCPDVIDQGPEDATLGALADVLRQSTVWYFWWD